jgi:hypothetical protein
VVLDKEKPGIGNIRGLNLAAVRPTTVQLTNRHLGVVAAARKPLYALCKCAMTKGVQISQLPGRRESANILMSKLRCNKYSAHI